MKGTGNGMDPADGVSESRKKILVLCSVLIGTAFAVFWGIISKSEYYSGKLVQEEFYLSGALRARTQVSEGIPDGLSEGWYTNGQLQVTEHYVDGISHGLRNKWYFSGEKKSEAEIVNGQIHGRFRRWYKNGQLAEDAGFSNGVPQGISTAFYESGYQKANVSMNNGKVVEQTFWKDGERRPSRSQ